MKILGIESSCDETSIAVVEDGTTILSNCTASQQQNFSLKGGVIPEDAARKQVESLLPVLHESLLQGECTIPSLDAIAVTHGPGLLGSLLVGTTAARVLSSLWNVPLIGVHHTLGHLSSVWLGQEREPVFPSITLSASGGHTDLWLRHAHLQGILLGRTRDDAAGEAFDKGASMLGLPYPGGPSISQAAESGKEDAYSFPLPLRGDSSLDFSFSGLKTALKYTIRDLQSPLTTTLADLACSYQYAICMHLFDRVLHATKDYPDVREIHLVGGVSANTRLRSLLKESLPSHTIRWPVSLEFCTDNAAMIASAGYFYYKDHGDDAFQRFTTRAELPLSAVIQES